MLLGAVGVPFVPLFAFSLARGFECISFVLLISYFGHDSSLRFPGWGSTPVENETAPLPSVWVVPGLAG